VTKDPRVYLDDILESIEAVESYTSDVTASEFLENRLVQDAVLRRLQIIGEAAKRVPADIRDANSEVPWREMAATRDVVVHDYSGLDLALTWSVATRDLPPVKVHISRIIAALSTDNN